MFGLLTADRNEVEDDVSLDPIADETECDGMHTVSISEENLAACRSNTDSVLEELNGMRESTEVAALGIGELLGRIVEVATESNEKVTKTLNDAIGCGNDGNQACDSIADMVQRQVTTVDGLVTLVKDWLTDQMQIAANAEQACKEIAETVSRMNEMTRISHLLAINLRIEASRMGISGRGFAALGEEVQGFTSSVATAVDEIHQSSNKLANVVPQMRQRTEEMQDSVASTADQCVENMTNIDGRTQQLTVALQQTLSDVSQSSTEILSHSNDTLSHLAFQDPVSQGIDRACHNVRQLMNAIEGEAISFDSLADIQDDVGEDGRCFRESGEVDLF